jgi:hypothetical protein
MDPAVVQAHVKLALAMVDAARRLADDPALDQLEFSAWDANVGQSQRVLHPDGLVVPGRRAVYELNMTADSRMVELLGVLFRRAADIEQQLGVAAHTPYPSSRRVPAAQQVLDRLGALVPEGGQPFGTGGVTFAGRPGRVGQAPAGQGRPGDGGPAFHAFQVGLEAGPRGLPVAFGLELTPAQFAVLLRRTRWQPGTGLLLRQVNSPGGPLGPWLEWARELAAELGTAVYQEVARTDIAGLPPEDLQGLQAFAGPASAASPLASSDAGSDSSSLAASDAGSDSTLAASDAGSDSSSLAASDAGSDSTLAAPDAGSDAESSSYVMLRYVPTGGGLAPAADEPTGPASSLPAGGEARLAVPEWVPEPSAYRGDVAAAARLGEQVAEAVARGEEPMVYQTENVTDGMAVEGQGGLTFELKLGLSFPDGDPEDRRPALASILIELHAAGLTRLLQVQDYLAAARGGGTEARDGWSLESGGVLVSPVLRDTPQAWADLRLALEIVARFGGVALMSEEQVYVGLGGRYGTSGKYHMALLRLLQAYQDAFSRLGTGLSATRWRPSGYFQPLPAAGTSSLAELRDQLVTSTEAFVGPDGALHLGSIDLESDRVGFGFVGASLVPAVVQAHVRLALAMANAALRLADDPALGQLERSAWEETAGRAQQPVLLPDGLVVPGGRTVFGLGAAPETGRVLKLLDLLYRRDGDIKGQLTAAALTPFGASTGVLSGQLALDRLVALVPEGARTVGEHRVHFPLPRSWAEQMPSNDTDIFVPERPFEVALEIGPRGLPEVFDGLEVTPAQLVTLLRQTRWQPGTGILVVGLSPAGSFGPLLEWMRGLAAVLGTHVYLRTTTDDIADLTPEQLRDIQVFADPRDFTRRRQSRMGQLPIVLRHVPAGAALSSADGWPNDQLSRFVRRTARDILRQRD